METPAAWEFCEELPLSADLRALKAPLSPPERDADDRTTLEPGEIVEATACPCSLYARPEEPPEDLDLDEDIFGAVAAVVGFIVTALVIVGALAAGFFVTRLVIVGATDLYALEVEALAFGVLTLLDMLLLSA